MTDSAETRRAKAQQLQGVRETRHFHTARMELREASDGRLRMSGLASRTDFFYDVGDPERGGFRERIRSGVFRSALTDDPDVSLLGNHAGWPLARTRNHTLVLREGPDGLEWTADLDPEDDDSRTIARKVDQGLVTECSFAFVCRSDQWNKDFTEREITGLSLNRGDVSVVTNGANPATNVSLVATRSRAELPDHTTRAVAWLASQGILLNRRPQPAPHKPVDLNSLYRARIEEMRRERS